MLTAHAVQFGMAGALKRTLNLPQLVFYGIGTIVGAGIYSIIGAAAGLAGGAFWLSFALASVVALLTALSYAELSAMFPRAGAEYRFLSEAFPDRQWPSFLAGWLIALNAAATAATVALAFANYLQEFVALPKAAAALGLLAACTAVNVAGLRQSTWLAVVLTSIECGGLLLVVALGFSSGNVGAHAALPGAASGAFGGILAATALVFFMYIGFEDIANLAEESRRPERTMPRALLASVVATSLLYLLVAFAVLSLADPAGLAEAAAPLSFAVARTAPWAATALAACALVATASTALITLVSVSRLLFAMARDGLLPAPLARISGRRKVPWVAALALFAAACALLPLGKVEATAGVSALGILLVFAGVQVALILLRRSRPGAKRPFRVPLSIGWLPLPAALGIAGCAFLLLQLPMRAWLIAGGAIAAGVAALWWRRRG